MVRLLRRGTGLLNVRNRNGPKGELLRGSRGLSPALPVFLLFIAPKNARRGAGGKNRQSHGDYLAMDLEVR